MSLRTSTEIIINNSLLSSLRCRHSEIQSMLPVTNALLMLRAYLRQLHQDLCRSYKEVCAPVIERCHFLFNELRPAVDNEVNAVTRSRLLKSEPRWREITLRMMQEKKEVKRRDRLKGNVKKSIKLAKQTQAEVLKIHIVPAKFDDDFIFSWYVNHQMQLQEW